MFMLDIIAIITNPKVKVIIRVSYTVMGATPFREPSPTARSLHAYYKLKTGAKRWCSKTGHYKKLLDTWEINNLTEGRNIVIY